MTIIIMIMMCMLELSYGPLDPLSDCFEQRNHMRSNINIFCHHVIVQSYRLKH